MFEFFWWREEVPSRERVREARGRRRAYHRERKRAGYRVGVRMPKGEGGGRSIPFLDLVCLAYVFGLYLYPFWSESDQRGALSWLLL